MINTGSFVNRLCGVQNIDGLSNDSSGIGLDVRLRRRGVGRVLHADRSSPLRKIPNRSADGNRKLPMHSPETLFKRAIRDFWRCRQIFPRYRGICNELLDHRQRMAATGQQHLNRSPPVETERILAGTLDSKFQGLAEFHRGRAA